MPLMTQDDSITIMPFSATPPVFDVGYANMLADQRLTAPLPRSSGGVVPADADRSGDPALDTADWQ